MIYAPEETGELLIGCAKVLAYGDEKHGEGTWTSIPEDKFLAALMRHTGSHEKGELYDPETGLPHLAHAMANLVLLWRKKWNGKTPTKR